MNPREGRSFSVLFLNRVCPPRRGATGRLMFELASGFAAAGWKVRILASAAKGAERTEADIEIREIGTKSQGRRILGALWILLRFVLAGIRGPRCDLVVSMTDPPLLVVAGRLIAFFKGARHIHWCQDLYPDLLPILGVDVPGAAFRMAERAALSALLSCDRIVVPGRCMARRLTGEGLDPRRIAVIPNWAENVLLDESSRPGAEPLPASGRRAATTVRPWHRLLRDEALKFRVLYAGTIGLAHPVETILDAAEILGRTHPEIDFVFVGEGSGHERLAAERARRNLSNVRQIPWQPESALRALMESGDIHLISMKHEAAGLLVPSKLYSALAVGRPCILVGPVHCETAKVIGDYRAGAVIPQRQPALLADAIRHYRENGAEWFAAHEGAQRAREALRPCDSIAAWIQRARDVVDPGGGAVDAARVKRKEDGESASGGARKIA